jgi:expansin (peptidoglycan-binding protein)
MLNMEPSMSSKRYAHYVGVRLSDDELHSLNQLTDISGSNQSAVIRFLVRTAGKRPEAVAAGIQREKEVHHEPA